MKRTILTLVAYAAVLSVGAAGVHAAPVPGPQFPGWLQVEGYFDQAGGDDIPLSWCPNCTANYTKLRIACGPDTATYRYIDVNKNVFALGLASYPETGLITGSNFALPANDIYAIGNDPSLGTSWWVDGFGCDEGHANLTVNNSCTWEASNCFGQNLSGSRYLWLYVEGTSQAPRAAPVLSPWGIAAVALLLAGMGVRMLHRSDVAGL